LFKILIDSASRSVIIMAPAQLMQLQVLRSALQFIPKRSCNAALRQKLSDIGVPKAGGRLFHTTVKKSGGGDTPWSANFPERTPPFYDGIDPSRKGGPPGGDELSRQGLGPEADNWRNWSPEKMEQETNYLLRLNKSDLDSQEHWVSFGYNYHDRIDDVGQHRLYGFLCIFQLILIVFMANYYPDFKRRDWGHREAYLEIARREALGLPLIDPDYIPPEKMLLPTDEELRALGEEPKI